jgi:hypothetical protein
MRASSCLGALRRAQSDDVTGGRSLRCRLGALERQAHVVVGHDPVALENAGRLVARDPHGHRLIDAGRDEVADRRARRSWNSRPDTFAASHALRHAPRKSRIGWRAQWNTSGEIPAPARALYSRAAQQRSMISVNVTTKGMTRGWPFLECSDRRVIRRPSRSTSAHASVMISPTRQPVR